jgi:hypothetical protein
MKNSPNESKMFLDKATGREFYSEKEYHVRLEQERRLDQWRNKDLENTLGWMYIHEDKVNRQ